MANVDETNRAAHRRGIIDLKRVVERKGVYVHRHWRDAGFGKDAKLGFHQVTLGSDEQNAHFVSARVSVFFQDLEIELDRIDIRHVLLGFPAHKLAGLLLLYALGLDPLDDHVASANSGDYRLDVAVDGVDRGANDVGDDVRVHHFAFHDGIIGKRSDRNLDQFWCRPRVIDDGDLDQA